MALTAEEIKWYKSFTAALRQQGVDPSDKLALCKILVHQDMRSHIEELREYGDLNRSDVTKEIYNKIMPLVVEEYRASVVPAFTKPSSDGLMKIADLNDNRSMSKWLEDETMFVDEAKINPEGTGLSEAEEEKIKALFNFAKNGRLFFSESSLAEDAHEQPIVVDANGEAVVREYSLADLFDRRGNNEELSAEENLICEMGLERYDLRQADNAVTINLLPLSDFNRLRNNSKKIDNRSGIAKDMLIYPDLYRDPVTRQARIAELDLEQEKTGIGRMLEDRLEGKTSEAAYDMEAAKLKGEAVQSYLKELYGTSAYTGARRRRRNMDVQIKACEEMLAEVPADEPEKRQSIQNLLNELITPEGRQQKINDYRSKIKIMKDLKASGNKAIAGADIDHLQFLISALENYEADRELVDNVEAVGGFFSGRRTFEEGALPGEVNAFLLEQMPDFVPTTEIYQAAEEYNVPEKYKLALFDFNIRVDALEVNAEDYLPVFMEETAAEYLKAIASNTKAQRFSANVLIDGQPVLLDIAEMGMNMTHEQEMAFVSRQVANAVIYGKKVQIIPTDKEGTPMEPVDLVTDNIRILDAESVKLRAATHFNMFNEKDPQKAVKEVGDLLRDAKAADRFVLFGKEQFANMLTAMDELNNVTQRMSQTASSAGVEQMEEYRKALDKANKAAETYIKYKGLEGKNGTETRRINAALAIKKYTSEKITSVGNLIKGIMTEKAAKNSLKTKEMQKILSEALTSEQKNRIDNASVKKVVGDENIVHAVIMAGMTTGPASRPESYSANAVEYYRQTHNLDRAQMVDIIHNHPEKLEGMGEDYARFMEENAIFSEHVNLKQMMPSTELKDRINKHADFYKKWYENCAGDGTLQDYFEMDPKTAFETILYDRANVINVSQNEQSTRLTYRKAYAEGYGGIDAMQAVQDRVGIRQFVVDCAVQMYNVNSTLNNRLAAKIGYEYVMSNYKGMKLDEIPQDVLGIAGTMSILSSSLSKYSSNDLEMFYNNAAVPEIKEKIEKDIQKYFKDAREHAKFLVENLQNDFENAKAELAKEECADKLYNAYMKRLTVMKSESSYNALNTENGRNAFMEAAKKSKLVKELVESPEKMEENPQKLVDSLMSELAPKKAEVQAKEPERQINEPQKSVEAPGLIES